MIEKIMQGELNLPKNMSSLAKDLVRNILVVDPNMRLEIAGIKQHKFFKGTEWDLISKGQVKPPFVPPVPAVALLSNEGSPQKGAYLPHK